MHGNISDSCKWHIESSIKCKAKSPIMDEWSNKIIHLNCDQILKINPVDRKILDVHTGGLKNQVDRKNASHIPINVDLTIKAQYQHEQKV